jgi:hypothetical protein
MTREEVIMYLSQMAEMFEKRAAHQGGDQRRASIAFMNAAAEAAVLLMEGGGPYEE